MLYESGVRQRDAIIPCDSFLPATSATRQGSLIALLSRDTLCSYFCATVRAIGFAVLPAVVPGRADRSNGRPVGRSTVHTCPPECPQESGERGKNAGSSETGRRHGRGSTWRTSGRESDATLLRARMKIRRGFRRSCARGSNWQERARETSAERVTIWPNDLKLFARSLRVPPPDFRPARDSHRIVAISLSEY